MKKVFLISAFLMLIYALTNQAYAQCTVSIGNDMTLCNSGQVTLPQPNSSQTILNDIWTTSGTGRFYPDSLQSPSYYIPSSQDVANGSVNLTCNANLNCGTAQATIKVTFTGTAPNILWNNIFYPSSVTSCGLAPVTATPYISNAASVQWSTKGTGAFDNPANTSVVYTPSAADLSAGTVILYINATGTGQCSIKDSFTVHLITTSIASLGNNSTVCLQNAGSGAIVYMNITDTAHVSFGGGAGSFYPNFQSNTLYYYPTASEINAGTVTLTASIPATSSCGAGSSQVMLTLLPAPIVNAGSNQLVCSSGGTYSQVILNGSASVSNGNPSMTYYWATNGTGTFNSQSILSTTYTPSISDFRDTAVTITLNTSYGSIGCSSNNSIIITFKNPLKLNQIPNIIGCAGSVIPIDSSLSSFGTWSTTGKGSILMNATNAINGYQSLTTDTIVHMQLVSFNDGICPQDTMHVELIMKPIVVSITSNQNTVGNTVTTCSDSVQLSGLSQSGKDINWSTNGTGSFSPSATGPNTFYHFSSQDKTTGNIKIFISASNSACTPAYDTINVKSIPPSQTIYAGTDQVVPSGNITLTGTHTGVGYVRWSTNGTGTFLNNSDTLINAVYQPSVNDYEVGILSFVLTGFDTTTACGNISSKMMVKIGTGYTISGQVLIGGPIAPSSINIDVYSFVNNSMEYVKTYTGPSAYTIVNIPSGTYILKFYLSDTSSLCGSGPTCQYLPTYLGDSTEWQKAYKLVITNANVSTMNTYLAFAYPISSSRIGTDSLYGVVTTATPPSSRIVSGQPGANLVQGATVSLIDTSGHVIYTTQTNASGEFIFKHIVQGKYTIIIDYPGVQFTPVSVSVKGASNTFNPVPLQLTTGVIVGLTKESVSIYPNPASAELHIDLLNDLGANTVINIIDQSGRLLSTYSVNNKSTLLNIDSLSSGLYLIQITDGITIVSSKFIKL